MKQNFRSIGALARIEKCPMLDGSLAVIGRQAGLSVMECFTPEFVDVFGPDALEEVIREALDYRWEQAIRPRASRMRRAYRAKRGKRW